MFLKKTEEVCPVCGSERVHYCAARVSIKSGSGTVAAGWWVCLNCWHKFNGATDDRRGKRGVLPATVKRRNSE